MVASLKFISPKLILNSIGCFISAAAIFFLSSWPLSFLSAQPLLPLNGKNRPTPHRSGGRSVFLQKDGLALGRILLLTNVGIDIKEPMKVFCLSRIWIQCRLVKGMKKN
jgi:hypothetical protein